MNLREKLKDKNLRARIRSRAAISLAGAMMIAPPVGLVRDMQLASKYTAQQPTYSYVTFRDTDDDGLYDVADNVLRMPDWEFEFTSRVSDLTADQLQVVVDGNGCVRDSESRDHTYTRCFFAQLEPLESWE